MPGFPLPATVLVVDDHPLFRKGVVELLHSTNRFNCVGEAENGDAGIALALALNPDLILLDLHMKGGKDGIAALQAIRELGIQSRIIILTVSDHPKDIIAAIRAGADDYLLKDSEPEILLSQIQNALFGRSFVGSEVTKLLAEALRRESPDDSRNIACLTERELEILRCLAQGQSNKLIARELSIMESTVKVHVHSLLRKLNFHSRAEVAVWAVTTGVTLSR